MMNKAYTTLIIICIILLTITPSLVQSECNDDFTLCWNCSDMGALSSTTYKANLKALLFSFPTAAQNNIKGYYNMSQGKEPDDQVTVIGLCRGDLELDPDLCKTCLNDTGTMVSEYCPSQKEAIIWGEKCMVKYSNDSKFHLMKTEPLQLLKSPHRYLDVDAETFNGGLKFLLQNLVGNASSNGKKYASGSISITKTREIYSFVQCLPSMSQNECSDCLNDTSSKILNSGVDGARVLKPSCTLRYENGNFYNDTRATIKPEFWTTVTPSLVQSGCNEEYTLCWKCSDMVALSSPTYEANLRALFLSFPTATQNDIRGYYNMSRGKEPDDQVTVIGLCRGDIAEDTKLCQSCLNETATSVLKNCPTQKEAIIWGEKCTVRYSNDSNFHLMEKEPLQVLPSPNNYTDVGAEKFNARLKFLLDNLTMNASSSVGKYASGSVNVTASRSIYSLLQCIPSMSQNECSDCLHESSSMIPDSCCGGVDGARVLKPGCTLRYERGIFYNPTAQVSPTTNNISPEPSAGMKKIVIIIVTSVIGVMLLIISIGFFLKMRKNKPIREKPIAKKIGSVEPSQFDFTAIRAAIEDFSDQNRLGQGGFGPVYKGRYDGQDIAVKRLSKTSRQGDLEFRNEVKLVANLQHRNLVRLLGFCLDKMERLLVYEYIPNSSLDKFIFDSSKRANMDWNMRYKIIEGIARGIIYLHVDSNLRIIHRDLKASNILLDEKMNPKISDFGMARLFGVDQTQDNTNRIVGTYGYMAPEYALYGHFSTKSDIFSFGVLLLEIVSGQKNNSSQYDGQEEGDGDLLTYAWKIWRDGNYSSLIDSIIFGCSRTEEIIRCVHIGLLCVQENPAERPTMSSILHMFNTHSVAIVEPSKPALFFESTYSESAMVQLNNSKSDSVEEATNDEDTLYNS